MTRMLTYLNTKIHRIRFWLFGYFYLFKKSRASEVAISKKQTPIFDNSSYRKITDRRSLLLKIANSSWNHNRIIEDFCSVNYGLV